MNFKSDLLVTEGNMASNARLPFRNILLRMCCVPDIVLGSRNRRKNKMILSLVNLYTERHTSKGHDLISTTADVYAEVHQIKNGKALVLVERIDRRLSGK